MICWMLFFLIVVKSVLFVVVKCDSVVEMGLINVLLMYFDVMNLSFCLWVVWVVSFMVGFSLVLNIMLDILLFIRNSSLIMLGVNEVVLRVRD